MKNSFLLLFLVSIGFTATAQDKTFKILGKVIDSVSGQPLANASVFCQSTTQGTITNSEGLFFMRLQNGGYDMVITYTGYEKRIIRISNNQLPADTMIIKLGQEDKTLTEVAVVATGEDPDGLNKYGKFFMANFIGTTPNAAECKIENPEVLHFFFSKKRNRLKVTSKDEIMIANYALGYKIRYQLDSFSYEYGTNISQYTGSPLFIEMDSTEEVKTQWKKNRARSYLGSRLHFMRSLYDSLLTEEGFAVEKLSDDATKTDGVLLTDIYNKEYYEVDSSGVTIDWSGRFRISYKSVFPDKKFLQEYKLPDNMRQQVTLFEIPDGFVIEENGYFYDQYEVINTGYWAWKKLAELLPYDYEYE
jgi:CarboxypepD_reg-like domain